MTQWKYNEDKILDDLKEYLASTYGEHYKTETTDIECFDAWIALGDSGPTFRNTAIKYLWRYGKKAGSNKKDLLKALHYIILMLHVEHYKDAGGNKDSSREAYDYMMQILNENEVI
jgi:hypothetical protein